MQQINLEKIKEYLNVVDYRWVLSVVGGGFLTASLTSLVVGMLIMPEGSKQSSKSKSRGKSSLGGKNATLSKSDVKSILDRNIFNPEGILGDAVESSVKDEDRPVVRPGDKAVKTALPLKLKGVIFGGDPLNGLALIENTSKRRINSFIVGDLVMQNARLVEVYEKKIIFDRDGNREFLQMEEKELKKGRRSQKKNRSSKTGVKPLATEPPPDSFKEAGFERQGHEIQLSSEYRKHLLTENMTKVLQDAKAEPNMEGGSLKGFRLTRIRQDSIYQKAGFQNGDVIQEINGIPLRDAAGAIRLLQQLRKAREIEVRVKRDGASFNMNVSVQ